MTRRWQLGIGLFAAAVTAYVALGRPRLLRWGATDDEVRQALPGDDLTPDARYQTTRAIAIHAPTTAVWPWIVQMGQGRAGFYSYDWLEKLLGFETRNVDRILPEFQVLHVGDEVRFHPKLPPMRVTLVEPGRALAFSTGWSFLLSQTDANTTRLLVRSRWGDSSGWMTRLLRALFLEPAQFLMERKMLLGIKERAERAMQSHAEADGPPIGFRHAAATEPGPSDQPRQPD